MKRQFTEKIQIINKSIQRYSQAIRETQIKNNETTIFFYLIDKILNG